MSKLTSSLEDQIYESNAHHRKERSCLEDQVKTLKSLLHQIENKNKNLNEELRESTKRFFIVVKKVF